MARKRTASAWRSFCTYRFDVSLFRKGPGADDLAFRVTKRDEVAHDPYARTPAHLPVPTMSTPIPAQSSGHGGGYASADPYAAYPLHAGHAGGQLHAGHPMHAAQPHHAGYAGYPNHAAHDVAYGFSSQTVTRNAPAPLPSTPQSLAAVAVGADGRFSSTGAGHVVSAPVGLHARPSLMTGMLIALGGVIVGGLFGLGVDTSASTARGAAAAARPAPERAAAGNAQPLAAPPLAAAAAAPASITPATTIAEPVSVLGPSTERRTTTPAASASAASSVPVAAVSAGGVPPVPSVASVSMHGSPSAPSKRSGRGGAAPVRGLPPPIK